MARVREYKDIIRRAMDVPRVVGAGIGSRPRRSDSSEEPAKPVLTILVEDRRPDDETVIASVLGRDGGSSVEFMEVGKVTALTALYSRPKN